ATVATLEASLGAIDSVAVTEVGRAVDPPPGWVDEGHDTTVSDLRVATFDRMLDRVRRRWSFSTISERATERVTDPGDDSLGDAGATDEPADEAPAPPTQPAGVAEDETDLPLGAVAGGAAFGTLVHAVLETVDFAGDDLDRELTEAIADQLRWNSWPVEPATLHAGLRAAIDTPLGPMFAGRRLRDLARADRLDELGFELPLGDAGRHASDRELGALVLRHLPADDPLVPWATLLTEGVFGVRLAGHLTGSIDAVFRLHDPADPAVPPRFVVCDYKTNTLRARGHPPMAHDYRPDRLPAAMADHHYPLQALLYAVALHRYLRWRLPGYDPAVHLGGAAYLFVRGMTGAEVPTVAGAPHGVFAWPIPPALVTDLSDLLDGQEVRR
ncbi:MAG: PD-(D/E)XK nuclease family protein, partial [Actinomycetota bacterium]